MIARETVSVALFAKLMTAGAVFATYTRNWQTPWDDAGATLPPLPMVVQFEHRETYQWSGRGINAMRHWGINLLVYAKIADGETPGAPNPFVNPGSQVLNPLIDALDAVFGADDASGRCTLGGLVYDCRIEGDLIKALGDRDPTGVCGVVVPIMILVP